MDSEANVERVPKMAFYDDIVEGTKNMLYFSASLPLPHKYLTGFI